MSEYVGTMNKYVGLLEEIWRKSGEESKMTTLRRRGGDLVWVNMQT